MISPALNPAKFIIGIDTGVDTGFAIWDRAAKKYLEIGSYPIDVAMARILELRDQKIFVRVEDARLAVYGRSLQGFKSQGAGSVKRDAKVWEGFLTRNNIPFEMVRPRKHFTKWPADHFKRVTGWPARTNSHGRDAAMICYAY